MRTLFHQKNPTIKNFIMVNFGILLVAIGVHAFKNPNKFALGGVSGLSIILSYFLAQWPIGWLMLGLNIILILLALVLLGRDVALKSAYGSFLLSGLVILFEWIVPIPHPLTDQRFLELLYGVFLPGIGSGIVFTYGATTGGTDIVAKILTKYFKTKVSISLLIIDFSIAAASGFLFGAETCLMSVLGVCVKIFVLDLLMESLQVYKIVVVVSEKSEQIKDFICHVLQRGATVHKATGAFTVEEREVITSVLSRRQARQLQAFIKSIDDMAFLTISNSSRIIGKGFGGFD